MCVLFYQLIKLMWFVGREAIIGLFLFDRRQNHVLAILEEKPFLCCTQLSFQPESRVL